MTPVLTFQKFHCEQHNNFLFLAPYDYENPSSASPSQSQSQVFVFSPPKEVNNKLKYQLTVLMAGNSVSHPYSWWYRCKNWRFQRACRHPQCDRAWRCIFLVADGSVGLVILGPGCLVVWLVSLGSPWCQPGWREYRNNAKIHFNISIYVVWSSKISLK